MNKRDLIKALENYPDNTEIFINNGETIELVESARMENVKFTEQDGGELVAEDEVFVLSYN